MTLTQGRQAQALINAINNNYVIETQDDLIRAYNFEMDGVTDNVVINAVRSELGLA
jgi:hypothetical protein